MNTFPTHYPDVNEILALLKERVVKALESQFVGMYLYGSLASGDFDPASSDIDFLIVTAGVLDANTIDALNVMHHSIWNSGLKWAVKLEGSYLPKEHLPRFVKSGRLYPTVNEGKFYLASHGSDWIIQRHVIREHGVVIAGPDPKSLIDAVNPDEIRRAVMGILEEWWFPMLEDPSWLRDRGTEYHAYAILSMCRSLYALALGEVVSKPIAARWVQKVLDGEWSRVIEQSLVGRNGSANFPLFDDALALIRYTVEKINRL